MLANPRAPEVGLPLLGGAASPSEKTARVNIVPQVREEVKHRRGGSLTGMTSLNVQVTPKRLEILREVVRAAVTVVVSVVGSARAAVGGCGWPWGRSGLWDSSSQGAYRGSFVRRFNCTVASTASMRSPPAAMA